MVTPGQLARGTSNNAGSSLGRALRNRLPVVGKKGRVDAAKPAPAEPLPPVIPPDEHVVPPTASAGGPGGSVWPASRTFTVVPFTDITERTIEWLVQGWIPRGTAVVLVGEEGIGKGLFCASLIADVTTGTDPIDVLMIVSEDDPETVLKARLRAAGVDMTRVHLMVANVESLTGVPLIPNDANDVLAAIGTTSCSLVIVDPWMSIVPGSLSIKDTQQARQALDPLNALARQSGASFLLVTHTNRMVGGSARNRYGGTVALRQASRLCLMAIADPHDPECLYVGVEKANVAGVTVATKYRKVEGDGAWRLEATDDQPAETIHVLLEVFDRDEDARTSDRWGEVLDLAKVTDGVITRGQVVDLYVDARSPKDAADKAIRRWKDMNPPRLVPTGTKGQYEVARVSSTEPPGPPAVGDVHLGRDAS